MRSGNPSGALLKLLIIKSLPMFIATRKALTVSHQLNNSIFDCVFNSHRVIP